MREQVFARRVLCIQSEVAKIKLDKEMDKDKRFLAYENLLKNLENAWSKFLTAEVEEYEYLLAESFKMQLNTEITRELKKIDKDYKTIPFDEMINNLK